MARQRAIVWSKIVLVGVALLFSGLMVIAGVLWYYGRDLPTVHALKHYQPPQNTVIYDRQGRQIAALYSERRTVVPLETMPRVLVLSVLAAEDADFYRHLGLDYPGILRAVFIAITRGRPTQGASTITQQVVKNLLLTPERSFRRKIRELILARRLERELSKDEILHLYLNLINFGHGRYGVEEASLYYFGKHVSALDLAESALLAGLPKAPTHLSPREHPLLAKDRQLVVLTQLAAKRAQYWPDLSADAIDRARKEELHYVFQDTTPTSEVPELIDYVKRELRKRVGDQGIRTGGYRVYTGLDIDVQRAARAALQKTLSEYDKRHRLVGKISVRVPPRKKSALKKAQTLRRGQTYTGTIIGVDNAHAEIICEVEGRRVRTSLANLKRYNVNALNAGQFADIGARVRVSIEDEAGTVGRIQLGPEGAVVVIDPFTRDVVALVGGYDTANGFNRAMVALRQPGSAFKPMVYGAAIRTGRYTPASVFFESPDVVDPWQAYSEDPVEHHGAIRLRQALAKSMNPIAVRLLTELTPSAVIAFARENGLNDPMYPGTALALGASEVRAIELTNAFATFVDQGQWMPYRLIHRVEDAKGQMLFSDSSARSVRQVLSPAQAYVMLDMMRSVVKEGTAFAANRLGISVGGKTGTSNEARDTWFVGFSPIWVAGVWVGYDDHRSLGVNESGAVTALPAFIKLMHVLYQHAPDKKTAEFPMPDGVVNATIDPLTGMLATDATQNPMEEIFVEGTVPLTYSNPTLQPDAGQDPADTAVVPDPDSAQGHALDSEQPDPWVNQ